MFCLSSRKLAAMFLPKTETAIPVFVPDPEASYQAYMMKQLPEGLWTTSICECYEDLSNCNLLPFNLLIYPFFFFTFSISSSN